MIIEAAFAAALTASRVTSDPARYVEGLRQRKYCSVDSSYYLGGGTSSAIADLNAILGECARENWDGHGAAPVSLESAQTAAEILKKSVSMGIPVPSIGADPDGQIALEWYVSPHYLVSVSVDPGGFLHYAASFGAARRSGSVPYYGVLPDEIRSVIEKVYGQAVRGAA